MWYVRDVLYAVLYVRVSCFVVRGCGVSRRYIDVCYCDMFSVVNVYLDHLKFCVVCINSRRYVCCGECYVVSNECNEPTSCLVQPISTYCCEVMYFGCFGFRAELGVLNCDDICVCRELAMGARLPFPLLSSNCSCLISDSVDSGTAEIISLTQLVSNADKLCKTMPLFSETLKEWKWDGRKSYQ